MTYDEAIAYLSSLQRFGWKLGLERMQALCAEFNHPERRFRSVHVGGSNGKGSTATMIANVLHESGFRTGLYLSPYVRCVRERVQVNGGMIPESEFARLMTRIQPVVEKVASLDGVGQPTEFEVKTILGFLYFAEQNCEFAVNEVGLGGRYDATNVIFPEVSVITNVTLDHTERLGGTIAEIAAEKAGIIKHEIPCVTGAEGEAVKVIARECHDNDASIWRLGDEIVCEMGDGKMTVTVGRHSYSGISLQLKGAHQLRNAALAVGAVDQLIREHIPIPDSAIREGLARTILPGRFQVYRENPTLILDGAHNPAKMEALAETLKQEYPGRDLIVVTGAVQGHDVAGSMKNILPMAKSVVVTQPKDRAIPVEDLAETARRFASDVRTVPTVPEAIDLAMSQASPEDVVCVTGSFYVVSEALKALNGDGVRDS